MKQLVDVVFSDVINFSNGGFKVYHGTLIGFSENPCYIDIKLEDTITYDGKKIKNIRCYPRCANTITNFLQNESFPCSFADASSDYKDRCFDLGGIKKVETVPFMGSD